MTKKFIQLLLLLLFIGSPAFAQFVGFEDAIPQNFKCANAKDLALSTSFYKEGTKRANLQTADGIQTDMTHFPKANRTRSAANRSVVSRCISRV